MLYLANVDSYFVFHGNLGLLPQVGHFFLTCLFLFFILLFISFFFTKYTGIFFMDEFTIVSICLRSVLIGFLFVFWLMRLIMVEDTQEAPDPVSTRARHLVLSILTITRMFKRY